MNLENKNILLVGAGGGFDIVSVQMIRKMLLDRYRCRIDTAGFLNPKFDHFFWNDQGGPIFEEEVNQAGKIIRFRRKELKTSLHEVPDYQWYVQYGESKPIVDNELYNIIAEPFFLFSLRYSFSSMIKFVNQYDNIIFCDVGGDILYTGGSDNMVKTPQIDGFATAFAARLQKQKPCHVMLMGLGTDNELPAYNIRMNMKAMNRIEMPEIMVLSQKYIDYLEELYEIVEEKYGGNTIKRIIQIGKYTAGIKEDRLEEYLLDYKEWFNKIYIYDAHAVCAINPLSQAENFCDVTNILNKNGWRQESSGGK